MKRFKLSIVALAAATLAGCSFGSTSEESVTAAPAPVTTPPAATATANTTAADSTTVADTTADSAVASTVAPVSAKPQGNVQTSGAHIDASAFLNALVDSGCQIDKAEYKEVKRGGAIKVVCSKTLDALNVELEDL